MASAGVVFFGEGTGSGRVIKAGGTCFWSLLVTFQKSSSILYDLMLLRTVRQIPSRLADEKSDFFSSFARIFTPMSL